MGHLRNIALKDIEAYLVHVGCKHIRTKGGHAVFSRKDLLRPIIIQTHIDPVPEFIIKQMLRHLKTSKDDFLKVLYTEL